MATGIPLFNGYPSRPMSLELKLPFYTLTCYPFIKAWVLLLVLKSVDGFTIYIGTFLSFL